MFDKPPLVDGARRVRPVDAQPGMHPVQRPRGETALQAIEWAELTARLEAARDLRLALRDEARRRIEDTAASFSDAAAKYFRSLEQSERDVNLGSLDQHKGCPTIFSERRDRAGASGSGAAIEPKDTRDER